MPHFASPEEEVGEEKRKRKKERREREGKGEKGEIRMDLEKREFQRLLEELRKKSGRGTELISVYIPPDRDISDVMSHLRAEQGQAMNIKSKSTRKNVHAALEAILSKL